MSTNSSERLADRLTRERLRSYLRACNEDVERALELYDWNVAVGSALHEDLGRFEIVFRNALDQALVRFAGSKGWTDSWEHHGELFVGSGADRTRADLETARSRATRRGKRPERHGKVVAELNFGFWRYLCSKQHLTSLWVPVLGSAFPNYPDFGNVREVRRSVEKRVQKLLFLRNRIAHHEPIHVRDLDRDRVAILEVTGWICPDTRAWIAGNSRVSEVHLGKPG